MLTEGDAPLSSSPDPLNASLTYSTPSKRTNRTRHSLPLQAGSPRKQTFELDVGNQLSPQKIRVTVEAGNSTAANTMRMGSNAFTESQYYAPTMRPNERTRTTTIPLKGLSDSEDELPVEPAGTPKRGRGRPQKCAGTPIPGSSKRLSATPVKKNPRRRTLGDLVDGDDEDDLDFAIGAGVEIARGKGRSRSRSIKSVSQNKDTPLVKPKGSPKKLESSTTSKKGRARRKTLMPEEVQVLEDAVHTRPTADNQDFTTDIKDSVLSVIDVNAVLLPQAIPFHSTTIEREDFRFQSNSEFTRTSGAHRNPLQPSMPAPCVVQLPSSPSRKSGLGREEGNLQPLNLMRNGTNSYQHRSVLENFEHPSAEEGNLHCRFEEEAREGIDALQDFDTVLESEGFSMISVDSVPSLREHLSSPLEGKRLEPIQSPPIKKTLLSVQEKPSNEDSFSSIAPQIFEAATPSRKLLIPSILAIRRADEGVFNDSFSSIPPEILEAVTPKRYLPKNKFLTVKESRRGDTDDSFSSIPPAILEAATPAKPKDINVLLESQSSADSHSIAVDSTLLIPTETSFKSISQREHSSRLLTPDETPPPKIENLEQQYIEDFHSGGPTKTIHEQTSYESSVVTLHMQSSPPVLAPQRNSLTGCLRREYPHLSAEAETPSVVFSSPSLPPLKQRPTLFEKPVPRLTNVESSGQSISPIVRAGRALQDIVVPVLFSTNSASLRSPFKSPVGDHKTVVDNGLHGNKNSTELVNSDIGQSRKPVEIGNILAGFSDDARKDLRRNLLIGEEQALDRARSSKAGIWRNAIHHDDPFTTNGRKPGRSLSQEYQGFTFGLHGTGDSVHSHSNRKASCEDVELYGEVKGTRSTTEQTPQMIPLNDIRNSETELIQTGSYERQAEVRTDHDVGETTEIRNERLEKQWAEERAAVSREIESASASQVIVIESDDSFGRHARDETYDCGETAEHNGEDIWQAEARHSSSYTAELSQDIPEDAPIKKPGRRKIFLPLSTKEPKIITNNEELAQISVHIPALKQVSENEHTEQNGPINKPTNAKSASFEPAAAQIEDMSDLSVMWHIPQKSNFKPRPVYHRETNKLDLSALFNSSPGKPLMAIQPVSEFSSATDHLWPRTAVGKAAAEMLVHPNPDLPSLKSSIDMPGKKSIPVISSDAQESRCCIQNDLVSSCQPSEEYSSESENSGESPVADESVHVHTQKTIQPTTPTDPTTPRKSCLRTPSTTTPSKSVLFATENPPSLPPSPMLSSTTWSKEHWKLLDSIYQDSKTPATPKAAEENSENDSMSAELPDDMKQALCSKYLGKTITSRGTSMKLEVWHLQIVALFRDEVWGWDEGVIAKRLFAIIVGEEQRRLEAKRVDS